MFTKCLLKNNKTKNIKNKLITVLNYLIGMSEIINIYFVAYPGTKSRTYINY